MPTERDNTPIPFTVADRLDIQAIKAILTDKRDQWDAAAKWVESRKSVEKLFLATWAVIVSAVGWVVSYFAFHKGAR